MRRTAATLVVLAVSLAVLAAPLAEVVRALRLPYDLRRTAVRNMVRGGTDPAVAMKISGPDPLCL